MEERLFVFFAYDENTKMMLNVVIALYLQH